MAETKKVQLALKDLRNNLKEQTKGSDKKNNKLLVLRKIVFYS